MSDSSETVPLISNRNKNSGVRILFKYADCVDILLMVFGTIFGVMSSLGRPLFFFFLGGFISDFIGFVHDGTTESSPSPTVQINDSREHLPITTTHETSTETIDINKAATTLTAVGIPLTVIVFFGSFLQCLFWNMTAMRQSGKIRTKFLANVMKSDLAWVEERNTGEMVVVTDEKVNHIFEVLSDSLPMAISTFSTIFFSFIVAFSIRQDLVGLILLWLIPFIVLLRGFQTKRHRPLVEREQGLLSKAAALVNECFVCIKTVISFNGQRQTITNYKQEINEAMEISKKRALYVSTLQSLGFIIFRFIWVLGMWYGAMVLADVGELVPLLIVLSLGCAVIQMFTMHYNKTMEAIAHARSLDALLAFVRLQRPTIETGKGYVPTSIKGRIRFQNVSFSYPSRPDIKVLDNFTIDIAPGEKLAVVGTSGSGKSTIAALLLRFYDCRKGTILLDEYDIRNLDVDWLRNQYGYVAQEPVLFDMSVRENIACVDSDATELQCREAMQQANAMDFVDNLPYGADTRVGARGACLSGGQKQMIAISRALLRQPTLLIFDEATSALDNESETLVQDAIDKASEGRTTITVAHRLSTVLSSHRIVVLNEGKIIEEGSPTDLIKQNGVFFEMTQQQTMEESTEPHDSSYDSSEHMSVEERRRSYLNLSVGDNEFWNVPVEGSFSVPRALSISELSDIPNIHDHDQEIRGDWSSLWRLIKEHKQGYQLVYFGVPAIIIRGIFYVIWALLLSAEIQAFTFDQDEMMRKIHILTIIWTLVSIFEFISDFLSTYITHRYADSLTSKLRISMLKHTLHNNLGYFEHPSHSSHVLSTRLSYDTATIRATMSIKMRELATNITATVVAVVLSLGMCVSYAIICSTLYLALFLLAYIEFSMVIRRENKLKPFEQNATNIVSQAFGNLPTVKAYSLQDYFIKRYLDSEKPINKEKKVLSILSASVLGIQHAVLIIFFTTANLLAISYFTSGEATFLVIWSIMLMIQNSYFQLVLVKTSVTDVAHSLVCAQACNNLLDEPIEHDVMSQDGIKPNLVGNIRFHQVCFSYPSRSQTVVLHDVSFVCKAGKTIALVGQSGSGKSSIIQLLQRLYTYDYGIVAIDDQNISDINVHYLHQRIVAVNQEPVLFDCSIWDNIAYGLPLTSELASIESVTNAAKAANIHDFIVSLPQGYDTEVGQLGGQLSGGQKQRIAIARALVREPVVLLLDEATAALDAQNEKIVQNTLEQAQHRCTCLVVAHRLSTIQNADEIFVLSDGEIVERGTHNTLMEKRDVYYKMCAKQIETSRETR